MPVSSSLHSSLLYIRTPPPSRLTSLASARRRSLVDVVDEKPQDIEVMEAIEDGGFKEEVQLGFLGELADFVNGMMRL